MKTVVPVSSNVVSNMTAHSHLPELSEWLFVNDQLENVHFSTIPLEKRRIKPETPFGSIPGLHAVPILH